MKIRIVAIVALMSTLPVWSVGAEPTPVSATEPTPEQIVSDEPAARYKNKTQP